MLPPEEGGVVYPDLGVVYGHGTANLSIVRRAPVAFFLWKHCLTALMKTRRRVDTSYQYQRPSDGGQFLGFPTCEWEYSHIYIWSDCICDRRKGVLPRLGLELAIEH
jgi:hypothetical protein